MATQSTLSNVTQEDLPTPHRCPWIVQYLLLNPMRRWMEPMDELLGPHVEPGMTVVEPGCGFGYVTLPLARLVGAEGRVVSVDVETRAIHKMSKRARRAGLADRIEPRSCSATDLGLDDYRGRVDLVVVIHTLHEFDDLPGFLAQCRALLKPGGRLLVLEPKGHVTPEGFAAELACCRRAGFRELDPPALKKRHLGALLEA